MIEEPIGKALEVINSSISRVVQDPRIEAGMERFFPGHDPILIFLVVITIVIILGLLLALRR